MPRALGQIDVRKSEAILEAAAEVLALRGFAASIEEVARRASVSKQTIYNHFGSKTDLVRALTEQRLNRITATLDRAASGQPVEQVLTSYAEAILATVMSPASVQMARMGVAGATDMPDLSRAIYDAGARAGNVRLAAYLNAATGDVLDIPDPQAAAEMFSAMVIGRLQLRLILGQDAELSEEAVPHRAREAVKRFMRAYDRAP